MDSQVNEETVPDRLDAPSGSIQSIERCACILRMLARSGQVRTAEVAVGLDLRRSSAHRYLASMEDASLIARQPDGSFAPGPLLAQLGVVTLNRTRVLEEAEPFMAALVRQAGQTVVLTTWGGEAPVVARVREEESGHVHVSVREGAQLPLDSSHGYLFAAHLDQRSVARLLTRASVSDRHALEKQVDQVRADGFAEHSMAVSGIRAIAVPVFGADRSIVATLAIVGTTEAVPLSKDSGLAVALRETASDIASRLGYVARDDAALDGSGSVSGSSLTVGRAGRDEKGLA